MYPLRFEPIYQDRLWGGRRLAEVLRAPLPGQGPVGEAWVLSDRHDHSSRVSDGPLAGRTLGQLMDQFPEALLGRLAGRFARFPLLLKFLDAQEMLSVQVHPSDAYPELLPAGETGKTEAWVVLKAGPKSRIYAGLKPGTTATALRGALSDGGLTDHLACFTPKPGDGVLLAAGTVHSLGGGVVVFEIQQNSDVTFRLYDWDHVDAKTGQPRALHVEQALSCIDFARRSRKSGDTVAGRNAVGAREAVSLQTVLVMARSHTRPVHRRRRGCAARARLHRWCGARRARW